jgi:mRNA-degrading endonuclease RelE of RelBE toxin-antitoxin system
MGFKIHIHPKAYTDIQKAVDYYNEQQKGLGEKFYKTIVKSFETLKANPYYQIRYDNIRCYYTNPFPFLIHFNIDEEQGKVYVLAIVHTSLNPDNNWIRR